MHRSMGEWPIRIYHVSYICLLVEECDNDWSGYIWYVSCNFCVLFASNAHTLRHGR